MKTLSLITAWAHLATILGISACSENPDSDQHEQALSVDFVDLAGEARDAVCLCMDYDPGEVHNNPVIDFACVNGLCQSYLGD